MPLHRGLAICDPALAGRAVVAPDLDLRLAVTDAATGRDGFCVLQCVSDSALQGSGACCYIYRRDGGRGVAAGVTIDGPMEQPKAARKIADIFRALTGREWGSVDSGHNPLPGMYWLQQAPAGSPGAVWQFCAADGKHLVWQSYGPEASAEVEEFYKEYVARACGSSRRALSSLLGGRVDLEAMTEKGISTGKVRAIRRIFPKAARGVDGETARSPIIVAGLPAARPSKLAKPIRASASVKVQKRNRDPPKVKVERAEVGGACSVCGRTVGTKEEVLSGACARTAGGLQAKGLVRNSSGKVVSKKLSALGKRAFQHNIGTWLAAVKAARLELGLVGRGAIRKGTPLYESARALLHSSSAAPCMKSRRTA